MNPAQARPKRLLAPAAAVVTALGCAATTWAQPSAAVDDGDVRTLLVKQRPAPPIRADELAPALRAQLATLDAHVAIVTGSPQGDDPPGRARWGAELATAEGAHVVIWLEAGPVPGRMTLWLVDARRSEPEARSLTVPQTDEFDMQRTLALAARSMLRRTEREQAAADDEESGGSAEPPDSSPERDEDAPAPEMRQPEERTSDDAGRAQDAPARDRRGPAPSPGARLRAGAAMGLVGRGSGQGVDLGWRVGAHLRALRHLDIALSLDLLRQRTLHDGTTHRNRIPIRLRLQSALPLDPFVLAAGAVAGASVSKISRSGPDGVFGTARVAAASIGVTAGARMAVHDDLFVAVPVSLDVRVGSWGSKTPFNASDAAPRFELSVAMLLGVGAP